MTAIRTNIPLSILEISALERELACGMMTDEKATAWADALLKRELERLRLRYSRTWTMPPEEQDQDLTRPARGEVRTWAKPTSLEEQDRASFNHEQNERLERQP